MTEKQKIILRTREEVVDFLVSKNALGDVDLVWVCPKCKKENIGLYYSHPTRCGCCRKFEHPVLRLSQNDNFPYKTDEIEVIEKEVQYINDEIDHYEDIVAGLENDKLELIEKMKNLKNIKYSVLKKVEGLESDKLELIEKTKNLKNIRYSVLNK